MSGIDEFIARTNRRVWARALCAALGVAIVWLSTQGDAWAAGPCSPLQFSGSGFVVCVFDPARDDLRLFWRGADLKPYGDFTAVAEALKARGRELVFAMNGGMYEKDLSPVGLYVEDGKRLQRADTREGDSNFHLKPNGVFWIGDKIAGVLETSRYLANPPPARFATQSGPMLVIDGRIHPRILPTGVSEKIRDGVCVRDGSNVIFAISEREVTFHAFALLFKDGLSCANALFLDGSVSSLYAPEVKRDDELVPLGPLVAVSAPGP